MSLSILTGIKIKNQLLNFFMIMFDEVRSIELEIPQTVI
jgi:hypothetical protein